MEKEKKYPALRFISGLYKVLAIVAVILGLLTATMAHGTESFLGIVGGVIGGISLWAFAELLNLFIDIEENTRTVKGN